MNDKDFFMSLRLRVFLSLLNEKLQIFAFLSSVWSISIREKMFRNVNGMRYILKVYRNWRGTQFAVSTLDKSSRVNINV